jgi:hypothetical protein
MPWRPPGYAIAACLISLTPGNKIQVQTPGNNIQVQSHQHAQTQHRAHDKACWPLHSATQRQQQHTSQNTVFQDVRSDSHIDAGDTHHLMDSYKGSTWSASNAPRMPGAAGPALAGAYMRNAGHTSLLLRACSAVCCHRQNSDTSASRSQAQPLQRRATRLTRTLPEPAITSAAEEFGACHRR